MARAYDNLPVSQTIPGTWEEMVWVCPPQWSPNEQIPFPTRLGRPMRYVVRIDAVFDNALMDWFAPPPGNAIPNLAAYQQCLLTLRDARGEFLVKNLPVASILMNGGDVRVKSKWWNYLPVDWGKSYATSVLNQNLYLLLRVTYAPKP